MTILRRNKLGRYSDVLSRSKEPWERGRGAMKKGNPSYKPSTSNDKKVYRVRNKSDNEGVDSLMTLADKFKKKIRY